MSDNNLEKKVNFNRIFWPIYFLNGFQSIAWGGIIFLIVPLSRLMWPSEPTHALEMGIPGLHQFPGYYSVILLINIPGKKLLPLYRYLEDLRY
jgi:hypothetical protein